MLRNVLDAIRELTCIRYSALPTTSTYRAYGVLLSKALSEPIQTTNRTKRRTLVEMRVHRILDFFPRDK